MSFHSQHHSFDIHLAAKYGIQKAILIHHFQHWIRVNRKRKKNLRNGKCWTYQSRADIAAHFPYFTEDSVIHHIEGLMNDGVLITENFNKAKFDKTLWYAFADEKSFGVDQESIDQLHQNSNNLYERGKPLTRGENPLREGENPRPIPDTKKEDTKESFSKENESKRPSAPPSAKAEELAAYFLQKIKEKQPDFIPKAFKNWPRDLDRMLKKPGRSVEKAKEIINWLVQDLKSLSFVQSASKFDKDWDALDMRYAAGREKRIMNANRDWALNMKQKFPEELKGLSFNDRLAINRNTDKVLSFALEPELFQEQFIQMFGGRYV